MVGLLALGLPPGGEPAAGEPRAERVVVEETATGTPAAGPVVRAPAVDETPAEVLGRLPYVPGRLIVKLTPGIGSKLDALGPSPGPVHGTGIPALDAFNRRYAAHGLAKLFPGRDARAAQLAARFPARARRARPGAGAPAFENVYALQVSSFLDMEAVARDYAKVPGVLWAQPDRKVGCLFTPNDPFLATSGSWGQAFEDLWGLTNISARAAWDVTRGRSIGDGTPIVIAVSDTGVDPAHPDIAANMWTNPGEVAGNGIDDDGNGFVDDVRGWDFANGDPDPSDDYGHGTHVAGTAGAVGDNGIGIAGVAWEAKVMPVKFLDAFGSGTDSDGALSILYAVDNGADVINASWGGSGESPVLADAIAAANAAGVVFVAAAGNSSADAETFFPANDFNAITVSAFDHTDTIASFSNFGPKIDVGAPGGGDTTDGTIELGSTAIRTILSLLSSQVNSSTFPSSLTVGGIYARQAGTSMAAPHVAGAAALVLASHPDADVEQVRQALRAGADDVDAPGFDDRAGYGRLNVARAVGFAKLLGVRLTSPRIRAVLSGAITIEGRITGSPADLASWTLEYAPAAGGAWTAIQAPGSTPASGVLGTWDVTAVPEGSYVLRARATATDGAEFQDRVPVVVDNSFISQPRQATMAGAAGAPLEIRGTATGPGFQGYAVEYRVVGPDLVVGPWQTDGIVLAGAGPVLDGLLATLDPGVLPAPCDVDFRLTVNGDAGQTFGEMDHVVVDPTLRPGWPRRIPGLPDPFLRARNHTTVVDLDGDGTKEVLAAYGDLVFAFARDGSDFPGWPQSVASSTPYKYVDGAPAAADLDGDGCLEVVTANRESIFVWDCHGNPKPGWPKPFYFPRSDVALVDLDGDGRRDIVLRLAQSLGAIRYPEGTLLSGFPIQRDFLAAFAVGDTDGDGRPEIAIVDRSETADRQYLRLYRADGSQRFRKRIGRDLYVDRPVAMGDVDGDGLLDIAVNTDRADSIRIFRGSGRRIRLLPRRLTEHTYYFEPWGITFHSFPEPVGMGDITGDGAAEVFVGADFPGFVRNCDATSCHYYFLGPPFAGADYLNVLALRGVTIPGWPLRFPFAQAIKAHGPGQPAIGDIDGDGVMNVVVGSGTCQHWDVPDRPDLVRCYSIYAFRPDGTLLPGFPKPTPTPSLVNSNMPAIGDLDGDGLNEIAWLDYDGNLIVWNVPGTPGPERMEWPMARHDPAGTRALR